MVMCGLELVIVWIMQEIGIRITMVMLPACLTALAFARFGHVVKRWLACAEHLFAHRHFCMFHARFVSFLFLLFRHC